MERLEWWLEYIVCFIKNVFLFIFFFIFLFFEWCFLIIVFNVLLISGSLLCVFLECFLVCFFCGFLITIPTILLRLP